VEEDESIGAQPTNLVRWQVIYPVSDTEATTDASAGTTDTSAEASTDSEWVTLHSWAVVMGRAVGVTTHGLSMLQWKRPLPEWKPA
jgi:hypothetical protein